MKRLCTILFVGMIALFLTGCVVYSHPAHYPTTTHFVYTDMEWVVWNYYDWDYDTVVRIHSYNYSPEYVNLILFLAYHSHVDPVLIIGWHREGVSWVEITTRRLRLDPVIFFAHIPPDTKLGSPYGKAYGHYWKNPRAIVLTEHDMINLVHLKVTCEAFHIQPVDVIRHHERGDDFNRIVRREIDSDRKIKSVKGHEWDKHSYEQDKEKHGNNRPGKDKPGRENKPDKDKPHQGKSDKVEPGKDKPTKNDSGSPDNGRDKPGKDKPGKDKPDKDDKDHGKGKDKK
ncbi:MAG: hypothetical protein HY811_09620 [Planctomycetes bacterium]|nr:hypothetical protein [Planctomycetota bacterium]